MSFTGDLSQLPIVDVIQLMNSTRKSGILGVKGRKGESQLVFKEGYIVSANHLNNSVRIGEILVEQGVVSRDDLERTLEAQKQAGRQRKPLIVTMLELGMVDEQKAYAGLQALIMMTIVEILTWRNGSFYLEAALCNTGDNYRFYPESINREVNVDTQSILMEALRVFDEKLRDGELEIEGDEEPAPQITEDDLGLDDLDALDTRSPDVFTVLDDRKSAVGAAAPAAAAVAPPSEHEEELEIEFEESEALAPPTADTASPKSVVMPGATPQPAAPQPVQPAPAAPLQGAARASVVEAVRKSAVEDNPIRRRNQMIVSLYSMQQPQEVGLGVLNFVAELLPRAVTLVVKPGEVVAERSRGLQPGDDKPSAPLGYTVPLEGSTQLQQVVDTGRAYMGELRDSMLKQHLLGKIGAPVADLSLLLPVRSRGKTVFIVYADYGRGAAGNVSKGLLEMVAEEAGHVLEKIMARSK